MNATYRSALLALILAAPAMALADREFSSLEERMTGAEFRDAGLHKLDDEELAALNRWLRQRSVAQYEREEAEGARGPSGEQPGRGDATGDRRGFPGSQDDSTIRTRIAGEFDGWRGETHFVLENGMVWKQAQTGRWDARRLENPEVEIKSGLFNTWQLQVVGYNRRVRVERVE